MGGRKRIGIVFNFNENWTGGAYYVQNVIRALKRLPDEQQPLLVAFCARDEMRQQIIEIGYSYLQFLPFKRPWSLLSRIARKVATLFGSSYSLDYQSDLVEFAFPLTSTVNVGSLNRLKKVFWIPDFQHKHLPHLFNSEEIESRDRTFLNISTSGSTLVLSSSDAERDFRRFYPSNNVRIRLMRFASVLPDFGSVSLSEVRSRLKVPERYFFAPNQFWVHKNHIVILRAAQLLASRGLQFHVLLTGKEYEPRNPDYPLMLRKFATDNGIDSNVHFLGFLDRLDQLVLMKDAIAVIQPSMFEGWSTVIEDAKALNKNLIVSDLAVHREQCGNQAFYFDPNDHEALGGHMVRHLTNALQSPEFNYEIEVERYANELLSLTK